MQRASLDVSRADNDTHTRCAIRERSFERECHLRSKRLFCLIASLGLAVPELK
jgi:hypothetical protein